MEAATETALERAARAQEEGRRASTDAARAALVELEAVAQTFADLGALPGSPGVVTLARSLSLHLQREAVTLQAILRTTP